MSSKKTAIINPGADLYRKVLAGFIIKGTTLRAYCHDQSDNHAYARQVLLGERNGPSAQEFRQRLAAAAGLIKPNRKVRMASELLTLEAA